MIIPLLFQGTTSHSRAHRRNLIFFMIFAATIPRSGAHFPWHTISTSPSLELHPLAKTWEPSRSWFWIRLNSARSTSSSRLKRRAFGWRSGTLSLTNAWEITSQQFSSKAEHNWAVIVISSIMHSIAQRIVPERKCFSLSVSMEKGEALQIKWKKSSSTCSTTKNRFAKWFFFLIGSLRTSSSSLIELRARFSSSTALNRLQCFWFRLRLIN